MSKAEKREIDRHRVIKISIKDSFMLYTSEIFGRCFCDFCWSKKKKLQKLKEMGADKIEGELNIVKIMNYLRNFKVVLKNSLLTKDVKEKIKHTGKNLIELDSGESSDAISEDTQGQEISEQEDPNDFASVFNKNLKKDLISTSKSKDKSAKLNMLREILHKNKLKKT